MTSRLEPELPMVRENGNPKEVQFWWQNVPAIQLETDASWWGNAVSDTKTGGDYFRFSDEPILANGKFLARKAALATVDCNVLVKMGVAEKIDAVSKNPYGDRVETEIRVKEKYINNRALSTQVGEYGRPAVVDTREFTIINDVAYDTAADTIQDHAIDGTYDTINDVGIWGE